MNILFITTGFPENENESSGIFNLRAYKELSKFAELEVLKICSLKPNKSKPKKIIFNNIEIFKLPVFQSPSVLRIFFFNFWVYLRVLQFKYFNADTLKNKPDIIHSVGLGIPMELGIHIAHHFGAPLVVQVIGSDLNDFGVKLRGNQRFKSLLEKVDCLTFNSTSLKQTFKKNFGHKFDMNVIYRGVDLLQFKYNPPSSFKKVSALYLGGLPSNINTDNDIKGGVFFIKSWLDNKLINYRQRTSLKIAGPNLSKENITSLIRNAKINSDILFLGMLSAIHTKKELESSSLVIIPSFQEGLPNVLLEAMASGCLVLASAIDPIKEIIKDQKNGFLFEPGNIDSLVSTLEKIYSGHFNLKEVIFQARQDVEHFKSENFASNYQSIYKTLL